MRKSDYSKIVLGPLAKLRAPRRIILTQFMWNLQLVRGAFMFLENTNNVRLTEFSYGF